MNRLRKACLLLEFLTSGVPLVAQNVPGQLSLDVFVYSDASQARPLVLESEQDAGGVLARAGVHVVWHTCDRQPSGSDDCKTFPANYLVVRLQPHATHATDEVFGMAFLSEDGTGRYCDVFLDRLEELHRSWHIGLSHVLGDVMAHELGHLLLGLHSHSWSGIMRAHWNENDLQSAAMGRLLFSQEESKEMRKRLAARFDSTTVAQMGPSL